MFAYAIAVLPVGMQKKEKSTTTTTSTKHQGLIPAPYLSRAKPDQAH
jgi:hypothetical protein